MQAARATPGRFVSPNAWEITMQNRLLTLNLHAVAPVPGWRAPLAARWRDLVGAWRRALAPGHDLDIDDATLRDLGITRGELSSYHAEAEGLVERTRLRVLGHHAAGAP